MEPESNNKSCYFTRRVSVLFLCRTFFHVFSFILFSLTRRKLGEATFLKGVHLTSCVYFKRVDDFRLTFNWSRDSVGNPTRFCMKTIRVLYDCKSSWNLPPSPMSKLWSVSCQRTMITGKITFGWSVMGNFDHFFAVPENCSKRLKRPGRSILCWTVPLKRSRQSSSKPCKLEWWRLTTTTSLLALWVIAEKWSLNRWSKKWSFFTGFAHGQPGRVQVWWHQFDSLQTPGSRAGRSQTSGPRLDLWRASLWPKTGTSRANHQGKNTMKQEL